MSIPRTFRWEVDKDGVATLTLDRPERMNALTFEVYAELRDLFRSLPRASEIRAVVITGAGQAFCTGGDVEEIIGPLLERDRNELYAFTRMTCDVILGMRRAPQPIIAAVNGTAAGAGAVIATACDMRVAADTAKIAFLFTKVGLSGADMGAAWLLPRIVGHGRATDLLMTGRFVNADEGHRIGLFDRVVPGGAALWAAIDIARAIVHGPAGGIAATKRALDDEWSMELEAALEREARVQADRMVDPAFRRAYEAWKARRATRAAAAAPRTS